MNINVVREFLEKIPTQFPPYTSGTTGSNVVSSSVPTKFGLDSTPASNPKQIQQSAMWLKMAHSANSHTRLACTLHPDLRKKNSSHTGDVFNDFSIASQWFNLAPAMKLFLDQAE